jgi:cation transport ATPase
MGSAGATAASEAAEAVIISSRVSAIVDAIAIGKRSTRIARQSVIAGMSLSMVGMVIAALGYLPPIYGALAQEGIDLAVILNALRALVPPRSV